MQVKTAVRYCNTPIKTAKKITVTTANAGEGVERQDLSCVASRDGRGNSHPGKEFGSFFTS